MEVARCRAFCPHRTFHQCDAGWGRGTMQGVSRRIVGLQSQGEGCRRRVPRRQLLLLDQIAQNAGNPEWGAKMKRARDPECAARRRGVDGRVPGPPQFVHTRRRGALGRRVERWRVSSGESLTLKFTAAAFAGRAREGRLACPPVAIGERLLPHFGHTGTKCMVPPQRPACWREDGLGVVPPLSS